MKMFIGLILLQLLAIPVQARDIVDMAGRQVQLPERIERAVGCVAPVNWLIYAIAPEKLAAFTSPPSEADWQILDPQLKNRPAIGSFLGGRGVNAETLLALAPDVVIFWDQGQSPVALRWLEQLERWRISVVFIAMDRLEQYPAALELLGEVLGEAERGRLLATYGRGVLDQIAQRVADIPVQQRRRVYYAQGVQGLETEAEPSFHAELIPLAGGINVHQAGPSQRSGRNRISREQLLSYAPDVILTAERSFYRHTLQQPFWQQLQGVSVRQVLLIPDHPLNWFDRPPSMLRFLGLQWLAQNLYPQQFNDDLVAVTCDFYRLFFQVELSKTAATAILAGHQHGGRTL